MTLKSTLAGIRARLSGRPDSEHEQAIVRLLIAAVLFLYLLPQAFGSRELNLLLFAAMVCYTTLCSAVFAWIYFSPGASPARRVFAAFLDVASTSAFMYYLGEYGAVLYIAYLVVTFGHGSRYGKPYLYNALVLSVVGFSVVLTFSDYWIQNRVLGIGLMVGMILLSLVQGKLVTRLFDSLRREEAANQAKRRFLSTVSHDMRTPLNAIVGMNDLLRDTASNTEQAEMVKAMHEASRSMLKLSEDVRDISKIEAGKVSIEETDFDLHSLINGTAAVLAPQAEIRGLLFRTHVMPEVPHALRGDPYHLRQVLYNLIGNGVKFTQSGSVVPTVSGVGESEHAVRLKFSIEDTGIGIAPEAQERIFESFVQADDSTTRRYGGTGLGTTISKQLVEMMGGQIGLNSTLGKGSTFWFDLTLKKQMTGQVAEASLRLNDIRIMLVGFSDAELQALEQDLATWGARTGRATGVEAGAARLAEAQSLGHPYHLVLLREDTAIAPGKNLGRLRNSRSQKAPPTVLCTAGVSQIRSAEALAGGFVAVLEMPFKKRLLFNAIHSATAVQGSQEGVISLSDYYAARDANRRRYQILVAEDNAVNQRVIVGILERAGHCGSLRRRRRRDPGGHQSGGALGARAHQLREHLHAGTPQWIHPGRRGAAAADGCRRCGRAVRNAQGPGACHEGLGGHARCRAVMPDVRGNQRPDDIGAASERTPRLESDTGAVSAGARFAPRLSQEKPDRGPVSQGRDMDKRRREKPWLTYHSVIE